MYACVCQGITEADVRRLGAAGIAAPDDLIAVLSLHDDNCCGRCITAIDSFVALAEEGAGRGPAAPARVSARGAGARSGAITPAVPVAPPLAAAAALAASSARALGQGIR